MKFDNITTPTWKDLERVLDELERTQNERDIALKHNRALCDKLQRLRMKYTLVPGYKVRD